MSERTMAKDRLIVPASNGAWSVQTRRADDGWDDLRTEWDDLAARCAAATPFQSYAWLESWWHAYGTPGSLRLILVRHGDRLVAAAPLTLQRRAGCWVLTPLGGAFSDFTDVLVDDAFRVSASRALAVAIVREPGWQAVDFPEASSGAVVRTALWDAWPGGRWHVPASLCLDLPAMPVADLNRRLPKKTRRTIQHQLNQLSRENVEVREVTADDTGRAITDLLRLHALQWRGRGINPEHLSSSFAEHLTRATRSMIGSGRAAQREFWVDDRLMASFLMIIGKDFVGGYLYGVDPALRERVDVSTMMMGAQMAVALQLGCSRVSLLRGAEHHKMKWQPRHSPSRRILLSRPHSAQGLAYATGVRAARAAVLAAKEHAPWLRTARDQARRMMLIAARRA